MSAALYARKSTRQERGSDEERSVERQIELAQAFADKQGWSTSEDLRFVDDGVSGGVLNLEKRRGLAAMLAAAKDKRFDVLIIMAQSRLARRRPWKIVHELHDLGVR